MSKRFVSWAAVSSLPQAKKISLDDQLATNREHIQKHGGKIVAELVVPGQSRSIVLFEEACERIEAYAQLRDLIARRAFDVLIYLDRSRLGRKASLSMTIVELCTEAGILCYETESPPPDLETPAGGLDSMLLGAIKSVQAQSEVNKLNARRRMGIQARVNRGQHPNKIPYGYKVTWHNDGSKSIVIDPGQAEAVRYLFHRYLTGGVGVKAIGDEMMARGWFAARGGAWAYSSLQYLLVSVWVYAGYVPFKGQKRPAAWEPLIDEETAHLVDAERKRRYPVRRSLSRPDRYSQCMICEYCGAHLSSHKRGVSYLCAKKCRGSNINVANIAPAIEAAIRHLADHANLERIATGTPDHSAAERTQLAQAQKQLASLTEQRNRLTLAFTREIIGLDEYERVMAGLAADMQRLTQQIDDLTAALATVPTPGDKRSRLIDIRNVGIAMLYHADVALSNAWLRKHFKVYVSKNRVSAIQYL